MELEEKRIDEKLADKNKLEWWIFRCAAVVFTGIFLCSFLMGSPALAQAAGVLLYFAVTVAGSRYGMGAGALTGMICGVVQTLRTEDMALLGISCVTGVCAGMFGCLGKLGSAAGCLAAAVGISALTETPAIQAYIGELLFALALFAVLPGRLVKRKVQKETADMHPGVLAGDQVSARRLMLLAEALEKLAQTFGLSCRGKDDQTACTVLEQEPEHMEWKNRYFESQRAIGDQFHEMGAMVAKVAGEVAGVRDITVSVEDAIKRQFRRQKLFLSHLQVLEYENGRQEAYLTLSTKKGRYLTAKEISEMMTRGTGRRFCPSLDGRSVVAGEPVTIKLEEEAGFRILTAVARQTKEEEVISGDTFSTALLPMGKILLCLSDGMGSGENAFAESEMVTDLMEQLLEAGFSVQTSARIVNSAMVLCREEQHPTTLDVCVVDRHTARCELLKQGACPTFIKRRSQVEVLDAPMLPAGILGGITPDSSFFQLQAGDLIIMVTDGVLEGMEGEDKEEAFKDFLRACPAQNPKELSSEALSVALSGSEAKDDMTVLVASVWRK